MSRRRALLVAAAGIVAAGVLAGLPRASGSAGDVRDRDGIVYRYYAGYGYRFQPLLSFAELNRLVSTRDAGAVRRLASALLARGVRTTGGLVWQYDFPYAGGPSVWTSGFTQAVAAEALARAALLLDDDSLLPPANDALHALRSSLVMPLGGGLWIREYGYTDQVILNAQLQSVIALEAYARIAATAAAVDTAASLYVAAANLLPRFDLGCWSRYSLGGAAATRSYHTYHVELLARLSTLHRKDPIWHATYLDWSSCLASTS